MSNDKTETANPLGTMEIKKLLVKFAVPSIVSFLVSALYNIVDQIFIGQSIGILGNAATNVAFPLTTICTATALLLGIGGASNFNLELGAGRREEAINIASNALFLLFACGTVLAIGVGCFLSPLMLAFGATADTLPYATIYTGITCFGMPFLIFTTGGGHLIRADGSPTYSMISMLSGAILNTILDPILIFGFKMGMAGAAYATVIGQVVSALIMVYYFVRKYRTGKIIKSLLVPKLKYVKAILMLGSASCFNQLAMTAVQIVLNNTLTYYGAKSIYGSDIPLACVGVIMKVNVILMAFILGITQGCQPIFGFNYGAKRYNRVREAYVAGAVATTVVSCVFFCAFQLIPRQIVSIFGNGTEEYFRFAERYFRIYLGLTLINGIQPLTANFFTSIGKAKTGMRISLTRQILFLLPLILIFPIFFGIDGVMYAGPIADMAAAIVAFVFLFREFRRMPNVEKTN